MKYSKAQKRLHMEKTAGIMIGNRKIGSRDVCKLLKEQGLPLCRSYVLNLMREAEIIAVQREISLETKAIDVEKWQIEMKAIVEEFHLKMTAKLRECPLDDPEDIDFFGPDWDPADLTG